MKKNILRSILLFSILLFALQCRPLYLEEAADPVPLSAIPVRNPLPLVHQEPELTSETLILQEGDNLSGMLIDYLGNRDLVNELIPLISEKMDLRRTRPGQEVEIFLQDNSVYRLRIPLGDEGLLLEKKQDNWVSRSYSRNLTRLIRFRTGEIDSSLYNAAIDAGIPLSVLMEMVQLYSFAVDFQRDIYKGDYFKVAYEEFYDEDHNPVDTGRVIFAYLYSNGKTREHQMFRYTDRNGSSDYYDQDGKSVRRELLKTPINGAHISSGFGMRVSPFLGYSLMHRGVDFAAAQGTPIYASGNGRVTFAGWSDVYGWYVKIRHLNHYESLYAHMVSFGRGIRTGVNVEQGQIIGYVGNTGMSTGPHCHYEVLYYGQHINPSNVKFPPGRVLSGLELEHYQLQRKAYLASFF